jgi:hypothetical protein
MLDNISNTVFLESESISLVPVVSAEWNQNLFNPPHITVAGDGSAISSTLTSGTVSSVTTGGKENFTTKSFTMADGLGSVKYTATGLNGDAYKVVTYIKTNSSLPLLINISVRGTELQYGSSQEEVSSLGWTKIVTYAGSYGDTFSQLDYTISANSLSGSDTDTAVVMFTLPQIYETTYFNYQNNSLWPTEEPFTNFRPGESYVSTGNNIFSFPSSYRKINNYDTASAGPFYSPITSITQNPSTILGTGNVPALKNALASSVSSFKYFVSDETSRTISAIYEKNIYVNKLVIKLNTIVTRPSINIYLNGSIISVDGSNTIQMPVNSENVCTGMLVLYWSGSSWTKTKWNSSQLPVFTDSGSLTTYTTINKITVSQVSQTTNSAFSGYTSSNDFLNDVNRMHVVEISPRLEIDLSNFVQDMSVDKSLDSKSTNLPISGINANTASVNLSGIPVVSQDNIIPIFSSQNNNYPTVLSGMLKKGIKLYLGYKVSDFSIQSLGPTSGLSTYIPAGIFYSDNWDETDISSISIQGYDIIRYMQAVPASDYVVNGKTSFDTISDILELSGFTDYDYNSLYSVCNNKAMPFDLYYYSVYSKDTTVIGFMNETLIPYQIAAYVDEYGIIKFKSLHDILTSTTHVMDISDDNIIQGGYAVSNKSKPGKISIKYTQPKIKQSPSLKNVQSTAVANSASSIYVASNDILWEQQKTDALGFNYVDQGIGLQSTTLNLNKTDLTNIFYSYNTDSNGYAIVENEVVSFEYKEHKLSTTKANVLVEEYVSIKNNLELQSEINKFIKKHQISLRYSTANITNAVGDGNLITYTANNTFKEYDYVSVTGVLPANYNITGYVYQRTSTSFKIKSPVKGTFVSGGTAVANGGYDITVSPTGNITNVKRGLFGTSASEHKRITTLASKDLKATFNTSGASAQSSATIINTNAEDSALPSIDKIKCFNLSGKEMLIYPDTHFDPGYQTYSVKFELPENDTTEAGLFYNWDREAFDTPREDEESLSVSLVRYNKTNPLTEFAYSPPRYEYLIRIDQQNINTVAYANVTGECKKIVENSLVVASKSVFDANGPILYKPTTFNLQVVNYLSDGSDGEDATEESPVNIIKVYLNGISISGWQIPTTLEIDPDDPRGTGYKPLGINAKTGLYKNPSVDLFSTYAKTFGFITTDNPAMPSAIEPSIIFLDSSNTHSASLLEIHATTKQLLSRSVNYYYQDIEFLDGIIKNRPIALEYPTYIMQTTPEVHGINIYDVEYGTPAAITALHSNIQYMWRYIPYQDLNKTAKFQKRLVDEYSVSYSTLSNTGHRGKIALANNASHIVYIKKDADEVNNFAINFTMWTNQAIVPSDPELIEKILDMGNASEVMQMDSRWIQSKDAAYKIMKIIEFGMTGFSKDIRLSLFGNPLIQVGDVILFTYNLKGITQEKCVVSSVSHSFSNGLSTSVVLNRLEE